MWLAMLAGGLAITRLTLGTHDGRSLRAVAHGFDACTIPAKMSSASALISTADPPGDGPAQPNLAKETPVPSTWPEPGDAPADRTAGLAPPTYPWARYSEKKLLRTRLCDLGLRIEGTRLAPLIDRVQSELTERGLRFRPYYWLSAEWFTPDGVPGIAISFFLAHPRLQRLEEKMMLEAEGGTPHWCLQILRHEVGHAIDNAFRLHQRKDWRHHFGRYGQRYPTFYQPKPYSKRFVLHLDNWYSQAHPAEDFAETFAIWLTPNSDWKRRYAGWPALKKLQYVDGLMAEIAGKQPPVRSRRVVEPLHKLQMTLGEHYEKKQETYGRVHPDFYDRDLRRLFSGAPGIRGNPSAARFLRAVRTELRRLVAYWTSEHQYTIDQVLMEMIVRCEELGLRLDRSVEQTKTEAAILLCVQTMNYLHAGYYRVVL
jgi:hypothetical protein